MHSRITFRLHFDINAMHKRGFGFRLEAHSTRQRSRRDPEAGRVTLSQHYLTGNLTAIFICFLSTSSVADEYKLQNGDILDFSVAGIAQLNQHVTVDLDGLASFPLIGEVDARGRTIAEVRDAVKRLVPTKSLTLRTNEGRDVVTAISADEVRVTIAEYRPIYISGDVTSPGEKAFRAGLTVRQAIALAGGYDKLRKGLPNSATSLIELRRDYASHWADHAKRLATVARLKAEIDGRDTFDVPNLLRSPPFPSVAESVVATERAIMSARVAKLTNETAHLQKQVTLSDQRIAELTTQFAKETEGAKLDLGEVARINELQARGVVPITRSLETRRLSLFSTTRALQLNVEIDREKMAREETIRQVARLREQDRDNLLQALQENDAAATQAAVALGSTSQKLRKVGLSPSATADARKPDVRITLFRSGAGKEGAKEILSDEDATVSPGDTVDVAFTHSTAAGDHESP